jgi:hypothetical protein
LAVYNAEREAQGKKKQDCPPGAWAGVPERYKWAERAAEWDKAEAERKSIELAARREAWRKTEETMAQALVNKGRAIIDGEIGKGEAFSPSKVNAARACFDAASVIARRALEMTDMRLNISQLSDAEIMRLLGVAQQAAPQSADDSNTP